MNQDTVPPVDARFGDYIQSASGIAVYPFDLRPGEFRLQDAARSLSRIPRYTGHTAGPDGRSGVAREYGYNVAQHSVAVSYRCGPELALAGLLHDAHEYLFGDISRPLKYMPELASLRAAMAAAQLVICRKYGLPEGKPHAIHVADNRMLATEVRDLMPKSPEIWGKWLDEWEPYPDFVAEPWSPIASEAAFLSRFVELTAHWGPFRS